jgi:hypothetical protein
MDKDLKINIKYKSDATSRNNLIGFLIDLLMNNTEVAGEFILKDDDDEGYRNG